MIDINYKNNGFKTLGVIGGMGPMASCHFYKRLIEKNNVQCDADHIDCIITNIASTPDRTAYILNNSNKDPYPLLIKAAEDLKYCGAEVMIIICNTSHYFIERLQKEIGVPFINLIDSTMLSLRQKNIKNVGIMATTGTIRTKLYENRCLKYNIVPLIPNNVTQDKIMSLIYDYAKKGKEINTDLLNEIAEYFYNIGCDKVILGCTELSLISQFKNSDFFVDPIEIVTDICLNIFRKK